MVRQKSRKPFEDLYSNHEKLSANIYSVAAYPPPPPVHSRLVGGHNTMITGVRAPRSSDKELVMYAGSARRRKNRKTSEKKEEKTLINEEKVSGDSSYGGNNNINNNNNNNNNNSAMTTTTPTIRKEMNSKSKPSKEEKSYGGALNTNFTPMYDNKNLVSFMEQQKTEHEKDEDTEEFFELIRETVENAVGKTLSELLNRNFREISLKVESLSEQMNATNERLNKLQSEVQSKIVHYGEENSRHFRYLCMKSEYDKMFYQHQSMITSSSGLSGGDARGQLLQQYQQVATAGAATTAGVINNSSSNEKVQATCSTCRGGGGGGASTERHDELPIANKNVDICEKSSELGMKEVLEQIQKFCSQLKQNDKSNHSLTIKNQSKSTRITCLNDRDGRHEGHGDADGEDVEGDEDEDNEDDDDDDDDLIMSSDEMSMLSVEVKRAEGDCMNFGPE